MKTFFIVPGLLTLVLVSLSITANAQGTADEVVATVGDAKIFRSQIDQEFHRKFAQREVNDELKSGLRSQILQRLVEQQLILAKFAGSDVLATNDEINLEISRIRERLAKTERTLEQFLKENHYAMDGLRFDLRWQISWKRYLDRTLTDQVLEKYFDRHRRKFDGTRLRVAHCLLAVDDHDPDSEQAVTELAHKIHQQISDGESTFENTVATLSSAPSNKSGGNIGWINYDGPMSRNFTDAAFQLDKGEVSPPVRTPHGIHLIKCLDVQDGVVPWYDAKEKVRRVATEDLFGRIARKEKDVTGVRILSEEFKPDDVEK